MTSSQIDQFVSLEIKKSDEKKSLVIKHMIHWFCIKYNPDAPCMENNECIENYPKMLNQETRLTNDGYPEYQRRDDSYDYIKD